MDDELVVSQLLSFIESAFTYKKKIEEQKLDPDTKAPILDKDGKIVTEEKEIVPTPISAQEKVQRAQKTAKEHVKQSAKEQEARKKANMWLYFWNDGLLYNIDIWKNLREIFW